MSESEREQSRAEYERFVVERYPDGRPRKWVHKRKEGEGSVTVFDPPGSSPESVWHTIATAGEKEQYGNNVLEMGHNPSSEVQEEAKIWVDEYNPDDGMGRISAG